MWRGAAPRTPPDDGADDDDDDEELSLFVGDPEAFAEQRRHASVVVVDATALWVKLRGEEKVYLHDSELESASCKARIQRLRRKFRETKS